jgi:branched-chain amino acid transport system permease protein
VISSLVVLALKLFYSYTRLGQAMLAASIDVDGSLTIDQRAVDAYPDIRHGGLMGGLAGILVAPLINIHYEMGLLLTLKGFCCGDSPGAHQSGRRNVRGVLLGLVRSLAIASVSSGYKDVITMVILILIT